MRPFTLAALVSVVLLPHVAAQFDTGQVHSYELPGSTLKTSMEAGDLDDDQHLDTVLLDGGTAVMVWGAGYHRELVAASAFSVNDIAIARARGTLTADTLIVVDAIGVHRLDYDPDHAESFDPTLLDGGDWADASRVLAGPLASGETPGLVGLSGDRLQILVLRDAFDQPGPTTSFSLSSPVLDLAVMDWFGDDELELLCLCEGLIAVFRLDGTPVLSIDTSLSQAFVTTFRQDGYGYDRVFGVLTATGQSTQYIHVFDRRGFELPLDAGPAGAHAAAARDLDGDGDDDFVVMHRSPTTPPTFKPFLFTNQSAGNPPGTPTLNWLAAGSIDLGVDQNPAGDQLAWPVLEDFTRDGDLDLLVYVASEDALVLAEGDAIDHTAHYLGATAGDSLWDPDADIQRLTVDFVPPALSIANPTHIEVRHWESDWFDTGPTGGAFTTVDGATLNTAPAAKAVEYIPLTSYDDVLVELWNYDLDNRLLEVSLARLQGTTVEQVGPMKPFHFSFLAHDTARLEQLFPGDQVAMSVQYEEPAGIGTHSGSELGGGLTHLPWVPSLDGTAAPKKPTVY